MTRSRFCSRCSWSICSWPRQPLSGSHIVALFAREVVGGAAFGIGGGYLLLALVNRLEATSGLYPILALAGGTALFGAAQTAGASGFLAAYLAGLILGSHRHRATQVINQAFDAFAWLSQIVLFLMLGLLVKPSALVPILGPSLVVAAVLMLVARPVAVALCLLPFRYTAPEIAFISWVGLRGAVPIFLAIIPVLAGLPDAAMFFGVAFIVVLISLILQGWTVADGRADVRSGRAAAPAGLPSGHRSPRPARRREHGGGLSSGSALPRRLQTRGGTAAPAYGERSGGDSRWDRSQRCVCPAARSRRLRARAGTPGGSCPARSRVRTTPRAQQGG